MVCDYFVLRGTCTKGWTLLNWTVFTDQQNAKANSTQHTVKPTKCLITTLFPTSRSTLGGVSIFSFLIIPTSRRRPAVTPAGNLHSSILILLPETFRDFKNDSRDVRNICLTLVGPIYIILNNSLPQNLLWINSFLNWIFNYLVFSEAYTYI